MKFIERSVDTAWLRYVQSTAADNWQVTYELQQSDSANYNALNSIPLGANLVSRYSICNTSHFHMRCVQLYKVHCL